MHICIEKKAHKPMVDFYLYKTSNKIDTKYIEKCNDHLKIIRFKKKKKERIEGEVVGKDFVSGAVVLLQSPNCKKSLTLNP